MAWSRTVCALGAAALVIACAGPKEPQPETPRAIVVPLRDAGAADAADGGPIARDDSLVHKFPASADSCWGARSCGHGRVCTFPDEDSTFGGCPVPGCRERQEQRPCRTNSECLPGYGCVLGHSDWAGPGDTWHCEKIRCAADADCHSRNMRCDNARCAAIACKRDSDCDGYCTGACTAKPGVCVVPHPPELRP